MNRTSGQCEWYILACPSHPLYVSVNEAFGCSKGLTASLQVLFGIARQWEHLWGVASHECNRPNPHGPTGEMRYAKFRPSQNCTLYCTLTHVIFILELLYGMLYLDNTMPYYDKKKPGMLRMFFHITNIFE